MHGRQITYFLAGRGMPIDNSFNDVLVYNYMPYVTGEWGQQQKERSKRRLQYFREYHRHNCPPKKVFRLGYFGELLAQKKLVGSKLVNKTGYDLLWNGQRIEVKTSQSGSTKNAYRFDIRIQKQEDKTDFFLALILEKKTRDLHYAYFIPAKSINAKVTLTISPGRTKYDRYQLRLLPSHANG